MECSKRKESRGAESQEPREGLRDDPLSNATEIKNREWEHFPSHIFQGKSHLWPMRIVWVVKSRWVWLLSHLVLGNSSEFSLQHKAQRLAIVSQSTGLYWTNPCSQLCRNQQWLMQCRALAGPVPTALCNSKQPLPLWLNVSPFVIQSGSSNISN